MQSLKNRHGIKPIITRPAKLALLLLGPRVVGRRSQSGGHLAALRRDAEVTAHLRGSLEASPMGVSPCCRSSTLGRLGDGDSLVHMGTGAGSRHHLRKGGAVGDGDVVDGAARSWRRTERASKPSHVGERIAHVRLDELLEDGGHLGLAVGALCGGRVCQT